MTRTDGAQQFDGHRMHGHSQHDAPLAIEEVGT